MRKISQTELFFSLDAALSGSITSNLRAVRTECENEFIRIYLYYHQDPSEFELETAEVIGIEVFASFAHIMIELQVDVQKFYLPFPKIIPEKGLLVFYRYESEKRYENDVTS